MSSGGGPKDLRRVVEKENFEWLDDRVCPGTIGCDMGTDLETRSRSEEEGKRCKSVAVPPL